MSLYDMDFTLLLPIKSKEWIAFHNMAHGKGTLVLPVGDLFQSVSDAHQIFILLIDKYLPIRMAEIIV